jgi:5-methylcytosine-specific restriction endonuclease McrA
MNKATSKLSDRKYFLSHKKEINQRRRVKYKTNPEVREARLASNAKYRKSNAQKINTHISKYYKLHPEKRRTKRRKYKASKRGVACKLYQNNYIFERDGWMCQICGRRINKRLRYPNPLCASIDHIIPLSKGGNDNPINVQASHLRCNLGKHAQNKGQLRLFG